jgi:hypothetical protein
MEELEYNLGYPHAHLTPEKFAELDWKFNVNSGTSLAVPVPD